MEELKRNPNYEYIQPPIAKYDSSQFALFDEIREVGYHHGSTFFTGLRRAGQASPADVLQREVGHYAMFLCRRLRENDSMMQ